MKCPACGQAMVGVDLGVLAQFCQNGCKGLWFEHGELQVELQRLQAHSAEISQALDQAIHSSRVYDADRPPLTCPKCGIAMHAHKFARDKEVNVDECYGCGGFFLDAGELKEIEDHAMSDAEVQAYTDRLLMGVPGYAVAEQELKSKELRLGAIEGFAKFLKVGFWS
jgi:Zn-finger nucleic acid-binding protein